MRPRRQSTLVVRAEGKEGEEKASTPNEPLYADQIKVSIAPVCQVPPTLALLWWRRSSMARNRRALS